MILLDLMMNVRSWKENSEVCQQLLRLKMTLKYTRNTMCCGERCKT